jgi:hypothetical protein
LPIGSGAIESAIRRVVNLRLKGASIYWQKKSAEAVLLLRSYYKAGRWNHLERQALTSGFAHFGGLYRHTLRRPPWVRDTPG